MKFVPSFLALASACAAMEGLRCVGKGTSIAADWAKTEELCKATFHPNKSDTTNHMKWCYGAAKEYCDLDGEPKASWDGFRKLCERQRGESRQC